MCKEKKKRLYLTISSLLCHSLLTNKCSTSGFYVRTPAPASAASHACVVNVQRLTRKRKIVDSSKNNYYFFAHTKYSRSIIKLLLNHWLGVCDIEKNDISIFWGIFSITIIRRYFAECVIVLISEYRAQLQFMIFFIFCVLSSHQWCFHLSLNSIFTFNKAILFLKVYIFWVKLLHLTSQLR